MNAFENNIYIYIYIYIYILREREREKEREWYIQTSWDKVEPTEIGSQVDTNRLKEVGREFDIFSWKFQNS